MLVKCEDLLVELTHRYSKLANLSKVGHCSAGRSVPIARLRVHGVRKRLGPEALAELVSEYQAGSPTTALMAKYHIGKGTVLRILDEAGVTRKRRKATAAQMQEAADLYGKGWSLVEIGEHFGFED